VPDIIFLTEESNNICLKHECKSLACYLLYSHCFLPFGVQGIVAP
jgi:hypothetical protein